ncbi:MAG: SDR family oxidoreductase [Candidatus Auribacterota bacterium]
MSQQRIALVTGANRGLGFEISRQLGSLGIKVYMGARDELKGLDAARRIQEEGHDALFIQLDVNDHASIDKAVEHVYDQHKRLDILVNNAGIFLDKTVPGLKVGLDTIRETMETNAYAPLLLSQAVIPIMRISGYGRIVNMSSGLGQLSEMGGGFTAYRISKTALNTITRVLTAETAGTNILINTMDPGWVHTDMGGKEAPRTPEEGAATAVWLATLPDDGPRGKFFRDNRPIPW